MPTVTLQTVGGSVMLALPPALLDNLDLRAGAEVGVSIDGGRLVIDKQSRPRYSLAALLAESDFTQSPDNEERAWIDAPPQGREGL